jgi:ATP-dependent Clp protease ATP-binding subunit ClpA
LTHGGILRGARIKENSEQRGAAVIASIGKSEKMILICDGLNNLSR